jgi:hypothetical protein
MQGLTWDIGILALAGLLLAYSFLIRRHKALATLVSVYIAYFVATAWGERVVGLFSGDSLLFNSVWFKANATPFAVQVGLLVVFTILLSSFLKLGGRRSRYGIPEIAVYSITTVSLFTMFVLLLMPEEVRNSVIATSKIAPYIYNWREWVLLVPVFAMVYFGIYGEEDV